MDQRTWKDLRKKDKLFILGFAPTTRHLAPFDDESYDAWALNEEYNYDWTQAIVNGKPDRNKLKREFQAWFQMHPRWDFTRQNNANHLNHPNWILNKSGTCIRCQGKGELQDKEGKTIPCPECEFGEYTPPSYRADLPIIMQNEWDDIPNSRRYPLKEASEIFGLGYPYFTSSVSMMLALAYLLGYPHVELYGFEMGTDTEYHYQRANGEFVMGYLMAKGMNIVLPQTSRILKGDLYGYKNMRTGFRQNLEMRSNFLKTQEEPKARSRMDQLSGQIALLQELKTAKELDVMKLIESKALEYDKAKGLHNVVKGAIAESENLTGMFDKFYVNGNETGEQFVGEDFQAFTNVEYENG